MPVSISFHTPVLDADLKALMARKPITKEVDPTTPHIETYWLYQEVPLFEVNTQARTARLLASRNSYYKKDLDDRYHYDYALSSRTYDVPEKDKPGEYKQVKYLHIDEFGYSSVMEEMIVKPYLKRRLKALLPPEFAPEGISGDIHYKDPLDAKQQELSYAIPRKLYRAGAFRQNVVDAMELYFGKWFGRADKLQMKRMLHLYNFVWQNLEALAEIHEKLPALEWWLPEFYKYKIRLVMTKKKAFKTVGGVKQEVITETHRYPFKRENLFAEMIEFVKGKLGLTEDKTGLWKWFVKLKPKHVESIWRHGSGYSFGFGYLLEFFRDTGKFPSVTATKYLSEWWDSLTDPGQNPLAVRLLFSAFEASLKAANAKQWAENEFYNIRDWWEKDGQFRAPDPNQAKAGWKWFQKQSEAYHRAIQEELRKGAFTPEQKVALAKKDSWTALIAALQMPELNAIAIPILSDQGLKEEGASMKHCVSTYGAKCKIEPALSRLFSIRRLDTGARLATCQIVRQSEDHQWKLEQIRGMNDHLVLNNVRQMGHAVALAYRDAQNKVDAAEEARRKAEEKARKEAEEARKKAEDAERARKEAAIREDAKGLVARSEALDEIPEHLKHILADVAPVDDALTPEAKAKNAKGKYGENNNRDAAQALRIVEGEQPMAG